MAEAPKGAAVVPSPEKLKDTPAPKARAQVYTLWPFDAAEAKRRQEATAMVLGVEVVDKLDLGGGVKVPIVLIPAGEFMMGDTLTPEETEKRWPGTEAEMHKAAHPRHRVRITDPFHIGECEVTRGEFAAFAGETGHRTDAERTGQAIVLKDGKWADQAGVSWRNPGFQQTDRHPVVCVSWNDAVAFCKWASEKTGRAVTLPTEAQWEYACRAGSGGLWPWGDREADAQGKANVADEVNWKPGFAGVRDGYREAAPVGTFAANPFGLRDMIGNASEWCSDWYGDQYYRTSPPSDPQGPALGGARMVRGGSWCIRPSMSRSASRGFDTVTSATCHFGFRVVVLPKTP